MLGQSLNSTFVPTSRAGRRSRAQITALVIAIACVILFAAIVQHPVWDRFGLGIDTTFLKFLGGAFGTFLIALSASYSIELYFVGYERSSLRMLLNFDKQIRYDLLWAVLPWTPIYATIAYWMTFGNALDFEPWVTNIRNSLPISALAIFPLQLVLFELVTSFLQYWQHRAMHRIPMFWEAHKFHHSAEQMTTLSLMRETPFTAALNRALTSVPAVIVGVYLFPAAPTLTDYIALVCYALFFVFNNLNQFLTHSNLNISYGWFGRYVTVSPANHRVHHSILSEHHGKNFSVSWVLWDRVFGTYHEGTDPRSQNCPVGYEGNIYNKSRFIVVEYLYPTFGFLKSMYAGALHALRFLQVKQHYPWRR